MRLSALTSLFFALFALFATVALAVPVAPQGAISKRQCSMGVCKDATPVAPVSDAVSPSTIFELITNLLGLLSSGSGQPPAASASTSTSVPTTQPTGV